ncbi:MAG: 5-(carboxyamino)imidazole ribonucleotide synthase [Pseudomonadota bacterium]
MIVTPAGAIAPGAVIGIFGGGQLGRMTALAAARLGYRAHVFCQDVDEPAAQVAAAHTYAAFDDVAALDAFADACAVVTLEWENAPTAALDRIAARTPVRPGAAALRVAQHRGREKRFAAACGAETVAWRPVDGPAALADALAALDAPSILKSTRLGYDGKGQVRLKPGDDVDAAWRALWADGAPPPDVDEPAILEAMTPFACEISVIVARSLHGAIAAFPAAENDHSGGILRASACPALVAPAVAAEAERLARVMAERLEVVGLLAVEMFVIDRNGGRDRAQSLIVNEIAPRPHNSGHWTMDGCRTDQFEQAVRAVCGLPLGAVDRTADVVMTNLLGDETEQWPVHLAAPDAKLHLYGKAARQPGRKMGHVNRVTPLRAPPGPTLGGLDV